LKVRVDGLSALPYNHRLAILGLFFGLKDLRA